MKSQTTEEVTRPAFKELNLKKTKALETQLKGIKGVKDVALALKAKKLSVFITLKVKEYDSVYQQVIEIVSANNFKLGRSYYIEQGLTVNLTQ